MDTDFLKDIIPYRCPKCGDSRKFTSLRDLKLHLNAEHAFKVGCVKPRTRTSIFNHKGHNSRKKAANQENLSRQWSSSLDSRQSSSDSYGRESPLLQSYREEAKVLERQLETAREFELNKRRVPSLSRSHSYDPLESTLTKLNKDVMNSRRNIWQSSDALYNAEDVINGVEIAAEERFNNQQNIIQNLVENLQAKERLLTDANHNVQRLKDDREKLLNDVEELFKNADFGNKKLIEEMEMKEQALNTVTTELAYYKQKTADDLKQRDEKLQEAERCLHQMEQERKALEEERENLVERVQVDSGLLRKTLEMKENQVRKLTLDLENMKHEQDKLLSESVELYNTAEQGTSKLKELVRERDEQLHQAETELARMKELNDRLVWESRQLTDQADEHSQLLHTILRQKEEELAEVKQELQSVVQTDRPKIVNEQIEQLQEIILEKTALLEQKENELQSLKTFLTTTAEKEAVAREKLEKFISDLIDRADRAEKQLESLKNQISKQNPGSYNDQDREVPGSSGTQNQSKGAPSQGIMGNDESGSDDIDSDDEMSDDVQHMNRPEYFPQAPSPLRRQSPVVKRKSGYPGSRGYKPADHAVPYSPSPCDSGYQDSKLASPRHPGKYLKDSKLASPRHAGALSSSRNYSEDNKLGSPQRTSMTSSPAKYSTGMNGRLLYQPRSSLSPNGPERRNLNRSFPNQTAVTSDNEIICSPHYSTSTSLRNVSSASYSRPFSGPTSPRIAPYQGMVSPSNTGGSNNQISDIMNRYRPRERSDKQNGTLPDRFQGDPSRDYKHIERDQNRYPRDSTESYPVNQTAPDNHLKSQLIDDQAHSYNTSSMRPPSHGHSDDNIVYVPYNKLTGEPVEHVQFPFKHQQLPKKTHQPDDSSQSITDYQQLPVKVYPIRDIVSFSDKNYDVTQYHLEENSQSTTDYQQLPVKLYPNRAIVSPRENDFDLSLSSSSRHFLPLSRPDQSLSSTDRQDLPLRKTVQSLSSSERQELPHRLADRGMSGSDRRKQELDEDNSLSDILSITDEPSQEDQSSSFQRIMDENGILWETDPSPQKIVGKSSTLPLYSYDRKPVQNQENYGTKTLTRLKMSDKFIEERNLFSENIKKMMKLPFLKESSNQAELSNDTLRNKRGEIFHNKENIPRTESVSLNAVAPFRNYHSVSSEPPTQESSTQTWMVDREHMDSDIRLNNNVYEHIDYSMDSSSSTSYMRPMSRNMRVKPNVHCPNIRSELDNESGRKSVSFSNKDNNSFTESNNRSLFNNKMGNPHTKDQLTSKHDSHNSEDLLSDTPESSSYVNLPGNRNQQKSSTDNLKDKAREENERKNRMGNRKGDPCELRTLGKAQTNTPVNRDLFEELKQESLNENVDLLKPVHGTDEPNLLRLNNSTEILQPTKSDISKKTNEEIKLRNSTPSPTIFGTPFIGNPLSQIANSVKGALNQLTNSVKGSEGDSPVRSSSTEKMDKSFTSEKQESSSKETDKKLSFGEKQGQNQPITDTSEEPSIKLPVQMSEDFEVVEIATEEEVDSFVYDKSSTSLSEGKPQGETDATGEITLNESKSLGGIDVLGDTDDESGFIPPSKDLPNVCETDDEDDIIPPEEELVLARDRRKSFGRQMSMDATRVLDRLSEEVREPHQDPEPARTIVEEPLSSESVEKTFFAQPDTEVKDEYRHSVSSMEGFTLSRSSSQDSLLSERLTTYSRRETTRRRRQALCHIFSFLDTATLIDVSLVCKEWKKISRHPTLWKHVYLKNQKCSVEFLLTIAKWCTSMRTLHIEGLMSREKKDFESQEDYLRRTRASLEPGLEKLLQVSESTLKTATIVHCENIITDKGLWLVSCYSRMVQKVTFISNTDLPGADVIWALGAGCRDIKSLNITMTDPSSAVGVKFNNKCLQVISQFCQDLQTLCIGGTEIDINGLVLIAKTCQRLIRLEIHYGGTVTQDTMVAICRLGLHNLTHVVFHFTPVEAKAILHLCKSSKHLQRIHISLDVSSFDLKGELKEDDKMKKYAEMVKNLKELEKKPGVGNILKLSCGEVFINTEKKFFGLF